MEWIPVAVECADESSFDRQRLAHVGLTAAECVAEHPLQPHAVVRFVEVSRQECIVRERLEQHSPKGRIGPRKIFAAPSSNCSSATLSTWRLVRRSRAIFIRASGFCTSNCSSTTQ